ncbi:hypothetical protein AA313_de0200409 [Arthrobotrys entomopaga]|nr:hypothetical protein AA313_de0200409 [Arthrobotrys entomopaga]
MQMKKKGVGELYNRMHDLWYITGLKYEALQGDEDARKRLELMETIAGKKALQNLTTPLPSPAGKERNPPPRMAIEARLNDDGYDILMSSEAVELQVLEGRADARPETPTVPPQHTLEIAEAPTGEANVKNQKRKKFKGHLKKLKNVLKAVHTMKRAGESVSN